MEQPTTWTNGLNAWALRGGTEGHEEEIAVIAPGNVAVLHPVPEVTAAAPAAPVAAPATDWSAALNLVEEACASLRSS